MHGSNTCGLLQDVIVKVTMSSICGSDMHPYAGRGVVLDSGITFGHEYTGVIVAVGEQARAPSPYAAYKS